MQNTRIVKLRSNGSIRLRVRATLSALEKANRSAKSVSPGLQPDPASKGFRGYIVPGPGPRGPGRVQVPALSFFGLFF